MAKFAPGNPGKKKGAKNNAATREQLAEWVHGNWGRFYKEMETVKGKSFGELFIKVLPFIMPQYQSINFSLSNMSEQDLEFLVNHIKQQMTNENETD